MSPYFFGLTSKAKHGMLADDIISGQAELAHADIANADDMMISDATDGAVKKVGVDSLRDHFFGNAFLLAHLLKKQ